ncbi:glycosyltransferase family 4 protein [Microvirga sp. STS02]|uniref:glycosyltransferase family 4 protein n=1 Tax=Hymenobacter negativus TaxID=2795026 RepID=UPI0018DDE8C3|nr:MULTISPECIES: glycosyltransferase family 4 protein [Bacteria]MBH8567924.1 glycosyltransferase family 4 protein [Hymenobacter negativus]MBR7207660.1 glycosyltransferase family 4 protein [Microvirga sp. STS02]
MPKVLVVGFANGGTGLGRVVDTLVQSLLPAHEVQVVGIDGVGAGPPGVPLHANPHAWDAVAGLEMARLIEQEAIDVVLINHDFFELPRCLHYLESSPHRPRLVYYCTVPGRLLASHWAEDLARVAALVVPTQFAYDQYAAACHALGRPELLARLHIIPHCVEQAAFYEVDQAAARAQLPANYGLAADDFVVLNANFFQERKEMGLTLAGFRQFAEGKHLTVKLWLHTNAMCGNTHIMALVDEHGLRDRVLLTTEKVPTSALNLLYNACDVGLNTANAEGWGLLAFEHGATHRAQVMPALGVLAELWQDRAELLPIDHERTNNHYFAEAITTPETVAAALEKLYTDAAYRATLAALAQANARQPAYSFASVSGQWRALFGELL